MRLLKHSTVSQWEASLEDADGITRVERTLLSYATVTHSLLVIFGPVVCVLPFHSEEEAVHLANGTEYGLAGTVWTNNIRRAHRVAHQLDIVVVWINDHHRIGPASPWGGFKMSGIGRENGLPAYHEYTQIQNIMVNLSEEPFDWYVEDVTGVRYS